MREYLSPVKQPIWTGVHFINLPFVFALFSSVQINEFSKNYFPVLLIFILQLTSLAARVKK